MFLKGYESSNLKSHCIPVRIDKNKSIHTYKHCDFYRIVEIERKLKLKSRKRQIDYKATTFGVMTEFSRTQWNRVFNVMTESNYHPSILYLNSLSFKNESEIFLFSIFTYSKGTQCKSIEHP